MTQVTKRPVLFRVERQECAGFAHKEVSHDTRPPDPRRQTPNPKIPDPIAGRVTLSPNSRPASALRLTLDKLD